MRRRHSTVTGSGSGGATVDPGKDLFAYLFILIMVFSFMLLMTTEERYGKNHASRAPQSTRAGRAETAEVLNANLGRLEKRAGRIVLVFGKESYDPVGDFKRLVADGRVVERSAPDGRPRKILYLAESNARLVSLAEYLEAFRFLGDQGISIAFAEKIN